MIENNEDGLNEQQAYARNNNELAKKRELVDMAEKIDKISYRQFVISKKIEEKFLDQLQPGEKINK